MSIFWKEARYEPLPYPGQPGWDSQIRNNPGESLLLRLYTPGLYPGIDVRLPENKLSSDLCMGKAIFKQFEHRCSGLYAEIFHYL